MTATDCTETELAETREWIVHVCMERHIAAGKTEAEARAIVEEAMIVPVRFRPRTLRMDRTQPAECRKGAAQHRCLTALILIRPAVARGVSAGKSRNGWRDNSCQISVAICSMWKAKSSLGSILLPRPWTPHCNEVFELRHTKNQNRPSSRLIYAFEVWSGSNRLFPKSLDAGPTERRFAQPFAPTTTHHAFAV